MFTGAVGGGAEKRGEIPREFKRNHAASGGDEAEARAGETQSGDPAKCVIGKARLVPGGQGRIVRAEMSNPNPMIIDAHVHLYPPEIAAQPAAWAATAGEPRWATLCTRQRKDGRWVQGFPTADELVRELDAAGVARAVLLGWYWERPETCAWQNRFFGRCLRAHPERFVAFATVNPRGGHWPTLQEMHRARDEGLIGIGELSPHAQGYAIDDPVFREVLTLAGDWKMPVNLHVTDGESVTFPGRVETPAGDFVHLAREFPRVNFILSHWGGLLPLRDPAVNARPNVFYDTAASPLIYDAGIWRRFIGAVGADRVLFGSDFPLNLYPKLEIAPEMKRLIAEAGAGGASDAVMGGNAERLLGL